MQVNGTVPTARHSHGFTSADGKLYVHGGDVQGVGRSNDLHVFDPVAKVWDALREDALREECYNDLMSFQKQKLQLNFRENGESRWTSFSSLVALVWLDDLSLLFDLEALVWAKRERLGSNNTLVS